MWNVLLLATGKRTAVSANGGQNQQTLQRAIEGNKGKIESLRIENLMRKTEKVSFIDWFWILFRNNLQTNIILTMVKSKCANPSCLENEDFWQVGQEGFFLGITLLALKQTEAGFFWRRSPNFLPRKRPPYPFPRRSFLETSEWFVLQVIARIQIVLFITSSTLLKWSSKSKLKLEGY